MPKSTAFFLFLFFPFVLLAQKAQSISGLVVDAESGAEMEYVTVIAADQHGKMVTASISDKQGVFLLSLSKRGRYTLHFSFMGYTTVLQEVDFQGERMHIPTIELPKRSYEIGEVVVKPLIRREVDRIVYDVGRDPDAAKMKMMEIMEKIPELRINPGNGNLMYEYEQISKILFSGHEEELISTRRQYPMEFIKASVMSQIEVILPGSAEYDNQKPILNITLARPLPNGIAWELAPSVHTAENYRADLDAVSKVNAIGIGINYTAGLSRSPELQTDMERINLINGNRSIDHNQSRSRGNNHSVRVNLFRPLLDNRIKVNLTARTSFSEHNSYADNYSELRDEAGSLLKRAESSSHRSTTTPPRLHAGASLRHVINNHRNHYTIVYEFSDSRNHQLGTTEIGTLHDGEVGRKSEGSTGTTLHVANLTYAHYLSSATKRSSNLLNLHLNYIDRMYYNTSDYYFYDYQLNDYVVDLGRFNGLNYRQNMANFRAANSGNLFKNKLNYRLEMNVEQISSKGTFLSTGNTKLGYREFNVFPKIRVNYKIKTFTLKGDYNTSVRRPNMELLNPYVNDSDPNNIVTGNPMLQGEYSHGLSGGIDKRFKKGWIFDAGVSYYINFTNNAITRLTFVDENNVSTTSYANLAKSRRESATFRFTLAPFKFIALRNALTCSREKFFHPDGMTNSRETFTGSSNAHISFKNNPIITISYQYAPAFSSAQSKDRVYYSSLGANAGWYFKKIHIGGSIDCYDLLNGNKIVRETIGDNTFMQISDRQRIGRTFRISLYWRFGRFKDPDKNRPESVKGEVYDMDFF